VRVAHKLAAITRTGATALAASVARSECGEGMQGPLASANSAVKARLAQTRRVGVALRGQAAYIRRQL
jgi:hypothetical protein